MESHGTPKSGEENSLHTQPTNTRPVHMGNGFVSAFLSAFVNGFTP